MSSFRNFGNTSLATFCGLGYADPSIRCTAPPSPPLDDDSLRTRADSLNANVLDGQARIGSIRWVSNQRSRWGSCTVATGDIRISDRLKQVPDYVLDAVIVHELTHTFIPNHSAEFYEWADKVPYAERARGYLEAYQRFGSSES